MQYVCTCLLWFGSATCLLDKIQVLGHARRMATLITSCSLTSPFQPPRSSFPTSLHTALLQCPGSCTSGAITFPRSWKRSPGEQTRSSSCLMPDRMVHEPPHALFQARMWDGCRGVLNADRNGFRAHGTHARRAAFDAGIIAMPCNATR
jgi:hypothetical protein